MSTEHHSINSKFTKTARDKLCQEAPNYTGVFAAGNVRSGSVKRCAAAVGEGGRAIAGVQIALAASADRK